MRSVLQAVIENATVTHTRDCVGLRIDPFMFRAAEIMPYERVQLINGRDTLETWIEPGVEGSGEVHVHTGARIGDVVTIVAFTNLHEGQTLAHRPKFVKLDAKNNVVSVTDSK